MENRDIKNKILNSLLKMMADTSLDNIFVKDIADAANISRQTFYRYFKDKFDVLNWYYDVAIESNFTSAKTIDELQSNILLKCNFYKNNASIFKKAYQYNGQNSLIEYEHKVIYMSLTQKTDQYTAGLNHEQRKKFDFSLRHYIHGIIGMTKEWLNDGCSIPPEKFSKLLVDVMPEEIRFNFNE